MPLHDFDLSLSHRLSSTLELNRIHSSLPIIGLFPIETISFKPIKTELTKAKMAVLASLQLEFHPISTQTTLYPYTLIDLLSEIGGLWFLLVQAFTLILSPIVDYFLLTTFLENLFLVKSN